MTRRHVGIDGVKVHAVMYYRPRMRALRSCCIHRFSENAKILQLWLNLTRPDLAREKKSGPCPNLAWQQQQHQHQQQQQQQQRSSRDIARLKEEILCDRWAGLSGSRKYLSVVTMSDNSVGVMPSRGSSRTRRGHLLAPWGRASGSLENTYGSLRTTRNTSDDDDDDDENETINDICCRELIWL
ncbi:hypothetical protein MPTK1_1g09990 [Marchantia polymorpha subsp. ruderalis]|uniref:Uncharacterized protein n=2 Tax=Marchantia polymorpha TaxID=3197 RepID=A0AAF6ANH1_MARPO|nr:hypothetical protein MARPO_0096s0002 [Marchantia polymorpha]BBM97991.1 hypothetical protein Mp_1g09990 [Marchantia polymorpha subsp. ruderalis]|eukprot:PTQ32639.1 hypothetical protein MARPO_0096s0002 [Marchantia polymorpha]